MGGIDDRVTSLETWKHPLNSIVNEEQRYKQWRQRKRQTTPKGKREGGGQGEKGGRGRAKDTHTYQHTPTYLPNQHDPLLIVEPLYTQQSVPARGTWLCIHIFLRLLFPYPLRETSISLCSHGYVPILNSHLLSTAIACSHTADNKDHGIVGSDE